VTMGASISLEPTELPAEEEERESSSQLDYQPTEALQPHPGEQLPTLPALTWVESEK